MSEPPHQLLMLLGCQEKESDELRDKCAAAEQTAADKDDELTSKNRKLNKKVDKYKRELSEAQQDVTCLKSELEQTRQDKVSIQLGAVQGIFNCLTGGAYASAVEKIAPPFCSKLVHQKLYLTFVVLSFL